jgi:soluble lytic murein transglycosylase-like protein
MTPEELLAEIQREEAAIAQLEATPTPTIGPSYFDRMKAGASMLGAPFGPLVQGGISLIENPRPILEEAASIGGSAYLGAQGAAAGLPLAPFTFGLSVPVGAIAGSALGSYADVPIQMGLDYLTGATPSKSRVQQATDEAILGAGIETALRGAGGLGRVALPAVRYGGSLWRSLMGPGTEEAAQRLVGAELPKIMVGEEAAQSAVGQALAREQLAQAAAEKEALVQAGLPAQTLTTSNLTGSPELARTEALLARQPLGDANITLAETAKGQIDEINKAAEALTGLKDPNPKRAGEAARTLLESAREKQRAEAGALFTDEVRAIAAPVTGIAKSADDVFKEVFNDTKVLEPSGELQSLLKKIKEVEAAPKAEKAPAGFGRQAAAPEAKPTITTVGKLQDLRSEALELSRLAPNGSRDELFADRLVEMLGKRMDKIEGTESLKAARTKWREFKQTWYKTGEGLASPLYTLLRKQNPEDIITSVGKKSAVSDEYARVVGDLEPNKLATEMADFVQQGTIDEKLTWLRNKRAVYADSPIMPVLEQWTGILNRIKASGEQAAIPGLSVTNIDTEARALLRALGGEGRAPYASGAEAGTVSATQNIARSGLTSALGGKLSGIVAAAANKFGIPTITNRTANVASTLADALTDPAIALKYVDDAAKYGKEEAARRATQDQIAKGVVSAIDAFAPRAGAFARSSGMLAPSLSYPDPTQAPVPETEADIAAEEEQLRALIEAEKAKEVPAPTPTPAPTETITVGKQNVSIPTGEQYAPASLVKAVMKVESGGKQEAVSSKGARGLMQLMPGTAKALGVDASDPQENVEGGSRYLAQQLERFGNEELALAAYNWGPENVKRAMAKVRADGKRPTWANIKAYVKVPRETREYVEKVLSLI